MAIKMMYILVLTIDKSYFLNLVVNNQLNDSILFVLNFLINMLYQLTNYHIIAEFLNFVMIFVKIHIINKLPIPNSVKV